jgi:hypothetical protein
VITQEAEDAAVNFLENVAPAMLAEKTAELRSTKHVPTLDRDGFCGFCGERCGD